MSTLAQIARDLKKLENKSKKKPVRRRRSTSLKKTAPRKKFQKKLAVARRSFEEMKSYSHKELAQDLGVTTVTPVVDNVYDPTIPQSMTSATQNPLISKIFPMWSFYSAKQGFSDQSMIGSKRINKFLKCKMVFEPPANPQLDNPRYYLISAWITNPVNLTDFTNPTKSAFTRAEMIQHILKSVQKDFDEAGVNEFVNFNPIETKHYKVVSYRRIKFDQNSNAINPQQSIVPGTTVFPETYGKQARQNHTFTWKLNPAKNTQYTMGTPGALGVPLPFLYTNNSWLPVVIYYSPDANAPDNNAGAGTRTGPDNNPKIYFNNQTWFTG